jgi:hypothetical protein
MNAGFTQTNNVKTALERPLLKSQHLWAIRPFSHAMNIHIAHPEFA